MNDNNFVMFGNYKEYFEMLNAEQCKVLILMLFEYSSTGELSQCEDININLVYKTITDNMIIGSKRRIASIENGKKGGRPKKDGTPPNNYRPYDEYPTGLENVKKHYKATDKQISELDRLNIKYDKNITKANASELLSNAYDNSYKEPAYEEPKKETGVNDFKIDFSKY